MRPRPGEVWIADLGYVGKTRPVVIVSRFDDNPPRDLVTIVPVTDEFRNGVYELSVPKSVGIRMDSWVNVQGVQTIVRVHLERRVGDVGPELLEKIRSALRLLFELK